MNLGKLAFWRRKEDSFLRFRINTEGEVVVDYGVDSEDEMAMLMNGVEEFVDVLREDRADIDQSILDSQPPLIPSYAVTKHNQIQHGENEDD